MRWGGGIIMQLDAICIMISGLVRIEERSSLCFRVLYTTVLYQFIIFLLGEASKEINMFFSISSNLLRLYYFHSVT